MSSPDPESLSLLAKVVAAGTAVAAPITWIYTQLGKKADKVEVEKGFKALTTELATQRERQADIFQEISKNESKNEQRHRELLMHLLERK